MTDDLDRLLELRSIGERHWSIDDSEEYESLKSTIKKKLEDGERWGELEIWMNKLEVCNPRTPYEKYDLVQGLIQNVIKSKDSEYQSKVKQLEEENRRLKNV